MKLADTQLVLLSAASQREDRGVEVGSNLKGGAAHKVLGKLLTEGLVEEVRNTASPVKLLNPIPAQWRRYQTSAPISSGGIGRKAIAVETPSVDSFSQWPLALKPRNTRLATSSVSACSLVSNSKFVTRSPLVSSIRRHTGRLIQQVGTITGVPHLGGLHHSFVRI